MTVDALSANGENLLALLSDRLAAYAFEQTRESASFGFTRATSDDPAERLLAPSPFDILRAALSLASRSPEEPFTLALPGSSRSTTSTCSRTYPPTPPIRSIFPTSSSGLPNR